MSAFLKVLVINARYEIKILVRSWFFKIFAVASILGLIGMDIAFYSSISPAPRFFRGLDSLLPFFNTLLPHFVMVIVLVFLSTDLYKRDRKFNTTDIIYIRDITNFAFISGRISGILALFFLLDVIYLVVAAIFNIFFSDLNFIWQAYLIYLFLLVLPSSVFVVGLSFFLMHLLRNQAIVIIVVIGLLAASIFYLSEYGFLVFDIMCVRLPLIYSDFTGLSNDTLILYQRMGWFFCGIFFLLLSVLLAKRLPQSKMATRLVWSAVIIMPVLITGLFFNYYKYYDAQNEISETALKQTEFLGNQNNPRFEKFNLDIHHSGDQLKATVKINFVNKSKAAIDTLYVLLNRSLKIDKIQQSNSSLVFQENENLRLINLQKTLMPGENDSIEISYNGHIDGRIAFPEIKNANRELTHYIWLFRMEVRHAFVENDYVLLPPGLYWYPQNVPASTRDLLKPFAGFTMQVATKNDLLAISQGRAKNPQPGKFIFKNDQPLKEISLIIGPYVQQTVQSDSLEFSLYSMAKHDYYKTFFKEIPDTLPAILHEIMQDFETKTDLEYPFKRLNLVEVPIHMFSYQRNGRENVDFLQAEQIWIPENAATLTGAYFKFTLERQQRFGNRSNQTFTDLEKEIMLFKGFANGTFSGGGGFQFSDDALFSFIPNVNMYPLFLNLAVGIEKSENNGFAIALEANIKKTAKAEKQKPRWYIGELTEAEEANLALSDTSFTAIVQNAKTSLVNKVLVAKGSFLLKQIKYALGEQNFNRFMKESIRNNYFKQITMTQIIADLKNNYGFDLENSLRDWLEDTHLPGYIFRSFQSYQIRDGDRLRYQVLFNVNNPSQKNGLFEVEFTYPGERRRRFMMDEEEPSQKWLFEAMAETAYEVGIILDEEPRSVEINTLVSQNLPSIYSFVFEDAQLKPKKDAIEGIKEISWDTFSGMNNALIADNASETFGYVQPRYRSKLKSWIHEDSQKDESEFEHFTWWRGPNQWQKLKFPSLYGEFVHSAYYARSGKGERQATWVTEIPEDGMYQVYVHVPDKEDFQGGRHSDDYFSVQKYVVYHADGQDEIEIDFSKAEPGWNYLETYFFKEGTAKIMLSDDSEGRMVLADAVKWELK